MPACRGFAIEFALEPFGGISDYPPRWAKLIVGGLIAGFCLFLIVRLEGWHRRVELRIEPSGIFVGGLTRTTLPWADIASAELIDEQAPATFSREPRGWIIQINTPKAADHFPTRGAGQAWQPAFLRSGLSDLGAGRGQPIGPAIAAAIRPFVPVTVRTITERLD